MTRNLRASSLLLLWLLTLIYSFSRNSCSANSSSVLCLESERLALLRFKQDLIVPSNRLISWTASQPDCCNWNEVVCDYVTGHVKELHLHNPYDSSYYETTSDYQNFESSMLQGKLNPCLLELQYLEYLDLSSNDFGEIPIPNFFGSMVSLTYLNITEASFQGLIPQQLGNLSNLQYLSIGGNSLHVENLQWLKNLSSLVHLDLHSLDLSAASHEWLWSMNSLPSLLELKLSSCNLAFIPFVHTINFTSLSMLDMSQNYFVNSSIPKWILSLRKLKSLDLSRSGFTGPIPNGISNLSSLSILNLAFNPLTSPSSDWSFGLRSLISLSLSGINYRNLFSSDLQNLTSLKDLKLSYVSFPNNTIPEWIYNFPHLETLEMKYANLKGKISSSIQKLSFLTTLDLSNNKLEGAIPNLSSRNLRKISLEHNKFSGNVPASLGSLLNVEILGISYNMLEGIVYETHFRNLTKLIGLDASNNNLTLKVDSNWVPPFHLQLLALGGWSIGPEFPRWLQTQHDLFYLDLSFTGISGRIPSWFPNITSQLFILNISHNEITGEIPSNLGAENQSLVGLSLFLSSNKFIGPLPQISGNLIELDLSNNSFSGSLSVLLCNPMSQVNGLKVLHLGKNNLSGNIPDCWKYWQELEAIILESNHLTGNIPTSISHLTNLLSLHLRNNNLFGEIPASLQNCSELQVLDLGFNYFVGEMPAWLGFFANLIVLALPSNNLEGNIPSEFCHLTSLQVLDISKNNLSGSLPTCINNLTAMTTMHIFDHVNIDLWDSFIENIYVVTKGRGDQYGNTLRLLTSIDISRNKLSGYIPKEVSSLIGLRSLNLSGNELIGDIPSNIGDMQLLESFDLSRNQISGRIPSSMSSMHFLSYLNLSYNNLSGEIPRSTQLQSFNSSSFVGNKLCGPPLTVNCSVRAIPPEVEESDYQEGGTKVEGFHVAMVIGFVVGFWGICGPLLYSRPWRISYYRFFNTMWCRLCVKWQLMWRMYHRG